jgi:hypothetical protein
VRRFRMAVVATIVTVGVVLAGSPAQAAPRDPSPGPHIDAPATAGLNAGDVGTDALAPGCYGQTDRPHLSSHVPGSINVVGRTVCSGYVVYIEIRLYRSRWFGWEQRGFGSGSAPNIIERNASESAAACSGTHDYLGSSYHEASDGRWATTSNRANGLSC